jgi:pimeloyl-ACP methyl ester carboxylesterase
MSPESASSKPAPLAIPEARTTFDVIAHDGAVIRVRQHGRPEGPRLVISHGNGLAVDGYFPFWGPLCDRYEVIVFDMRNHGRNPVHDLEAHDWVNFARDIGRVFNGITENLQNKSAVGIFHSLSAAAGLANAIEEAPDWHALVAVDPPSPPPEGHPLQDLHDRDMEELGRRARRRPERYRSLGMLEFLLRAGKESQSWVPGAQKMMAAATVHADEVAGDFVSACPPAFEARCFETNDDARTWERGGAIACPVLVLGGDPDSPLARSTAAISVELAERHGWAYDFVPETSHFLQLEQPEKAIAAIEEFLAMLKPAARIAR